MDIWTGNDWVDEDVCQVCYQPECPHSKGGSRRADVMKLAPGQRDYRGYGEWAVHPDEASFILHRGYAIVEGTQQRVAFIHNEAFVTQIKVTGSGAEVSSYQV